MEFLEKKHLILISTAIAIFIGISLLVNKGQEVSEKSFDANPDVEQVEPLSETHHAFVRPELDERELKQAKVKKAFNKKMDRFKRKNKINSKLVQTRAHEFHSNDGQTLSNNNKTMKKKTGVTEEQKLKNLEEIELKVAEQCQYHKEPVTCAKNLKQQLADQAEIEKCKASSKDESKIKECKTKLTATIAKRKEKEKAENAQKKSAADKKKLAVQKEIEEQRKRQEQQAENNTNNDQNDNEADTDSAQDQPTDVVTSIQNQVPNTNETDNINPNDEKPALSLDDWRRYLEEEGGNLLKKALELFAATKKSGKENLPQAMFFTLINEYYLQSTVVEIQRSGIQALQKLPGVTSFQMTVAFFNQKGSALETLPEPYNDLFEVNFKQTYESPINFHFLGSLLKTAGSSPSNTELNTVNEVDHVIVAVNFIDDISTKLSGAIGEQREDNEVYQKYSPYLSSLNGSINPGLLHLINSTSAALKDNAIVTLTNVESLIEKINALKSDLTPEQVQPSEGSFFGERVIGRK